MRLSTSYMMNVLYPIWSDLICSDLILSYVLYWWINQVVNILHRESGCQLRTWWMSHILSYLILSYLILSYRIVSYRIVSFRIVSYRIESGCQYRISYIMNQAVNIFYHEWIRLSISSNESGCQYAVNILNIMNQAVNMLSISYIMNQAVNV